MQEKKEEKLGMLDFDDNDNVDDDFGVDSIAQNEEMATQASPAHQFDGISLVEKKNCFVKVHQDGNFTVSDKASSPTDTIMDSKAVWQFLSEPQAFLVRDLETCDVVV